MEKTLKYTLTLDGAFPEETLSGGIQGENKATAIVFEADSALQSKISHYKSQGKSIEAEIKAVTEAGECVGQTTQTGENLFSPFYLTDRVTSSGLDVIIVFKIHLAGEQKEICKAQIRLSFVPSPVFCEFESEEKSEAEQLVEKAEEITAEMEERAEDIKKIIEQKLNDVQTAARLTAQQLKTVKEIAEEANQTRLELESGTEFVFLGGDAQGNGGAAFIIDEQLSKVSGNPIANKVVAKAIEELSTDYIVEQGERYVPSAIAPNHTDTWTYRKWNSGAIECWLKNTLIDFSLGSFTDSTGIVDSSGNNIIFKWVDISLPFTFSGLPMVTGSAQWKTTEWFDCQPTSSGLIRLRWLGVPSSFTAEPANQLKVSLYVKGSWK